MTDQELRMWRADRELISARSPRLDGLRHVGWLIENEAEGIRLLWGHQPKTMLDSVRLDGFSTFPLYAGARHAGAEPQRAAGVLGTYKDCPTCAHRDNPGARGPCKSCTRLFPDFYTLTEEQKAANLALLQSCAAGVSLVDGQTKPLSGTAAPLVSEPAVPQEMPTGLESLICDPLAEWRKK